jgi:hypothetical protein
VLSMLAVEGRQHIYYERFSLTLGNGVDLEGSEVGEILSRCSRVLVVRIAYRSALGLT